jgi:phage tail sheath protein FI
MPIVQQGSINTTALVVPDLFVQIVPPQTYLLNGVPTNVIGVVGTASWGPTNTPTIIGNMAMYAQTFGPIMARKYDAGTQVATAVQQGAQNFIVVRVTDGSDAAASIIVQTNCITFTALYSGSLGNSISVTIGTGSKTGTYSVVVALTGVAIEKFDNISGSGATLWSNMAAAINTGVGQLRNASNLIVATAGGGTANPTLTNYTLSGGSDGVNSISASTLVGLDTVPRKGMYCLRNQQVSVGVLADADDSTQWGVIDGFGLSEGIFMQQVLPSGTSISSAVTAKQGAGIDSYATKMLHGDWVWWQDNTNNVIRLVSPQGFSAGRYANLSPEQSGLNKPLYGIIGTQKTGINPLANTSYSSAELQTLFLGGLDVLTNPGAGGLNIFTMRDGNNSSSNAAINGDNYTRMTNYIAATLAAGMGVYVGRTITKDLFRQVRATLLAYLTGMMQQGMLGSTDGTLPFSVVCDVTNNPPSRTALDYLQADVSVRYLGIAKYFICNIQGGQTVVIQQPNATQGA